MQTNEVLDCIGRAWEFPWEQEYEEYLESQEDDEDEEDDDFGGFWDTKGL